MLKRPENWAKLRRLLVHMGGDWADLEYQYERVPFERIRRITGYLVGTTDRFNDGKRAEEHDRVKHQEDELQSDVPDYLNPHRMVRGALDAWMNDRLDRAPGFDSGRGI